MDIFYFAAFVAPVIALLERNHRRHHFPHTAWGAVIDRDLERVRHDLDATDGRGHEGTGDPRPTSTSVPQTRTQPARQANAAVCRPASS